MPHESVPDWLVVIGILALAAMLMLGWWRYEIEQEENMNSQECNCSNPHCQV